MSAFGSSMGTFIGMSGISAPGIAMFEIAFAVSSTVDVKTATNVYGRGKVNVKHQADALGASEIRPCGALQY